MQVGYQEWVGKVINSLPSTAHLETGRQELAGASCGAGCRAHCPSSGKKIPSIIPFSDLNSKKLNYYLFNCSIPLLCICSSNPRA